MNIFPHLKTHYNFGFIPYNGFPVAWLVSQSIQQEMIKSYQTQPNDVYLISYPKAGQHFLKKICIELIRHHDKEKTHEAYSSSDIGFNTVPLVELFASQNGIDAIYQRNKDLQNTLNLWWTHNNYSLFPANKDRLNPNTKYIVINRNPKDLLVSYCIWQNSIDHEWGGLQPQCSLDEFFCRFISGMVYFGDYFDWTVDWFDAYNNYVFNNNNQMLFIYYEDVINDPFDEIKRIANFLYPNDNVLTENDINNVVRLSAFDQMKKVHTSNPQSFVWGEQMFRKGKINDWKNHLNEKQSMLLDDIMWIKWAQKGTGIKYYSQLMEKYAEFDHGYHNDKKHN
eukprot:51891_1